MDLASYDRLFPSQDVLPASGGVGNLIAAPLHGQCRRRGGTVFLDLGTLEPHEDQWAYLSSLDRLSPRQVSRQYSPPPSPAAPPATPASASPTPGAGHDNRVSRTSAGPASSPAAA
jgi:hypothetical protein